MMDEIKRKYHEVANIFPLMSGDDFDALKADIAENGQREAIWLHTDGSIIDGRNRHRACIELGIEPMFRTWHGDGSLVSFVVSLNMHRRHLTSSQRTAIGLDILPMIEAEAKQRQITLAGTRHDLDQQIDQGRAPQSAKQAATIVGTNHQYISDLKRISQAIPEAIGLVRDGTLTMAGARKLERVHESARQSVTDLLTSGEEVDVQKAIRRVVSDNLVDKSPQMPTGKYRVIYADPPWAYGNTMPPGTTQPDEYYRLMTSAEIAAMPIRDIACDDSVLFLWTTSPHLEESFLVVNGWGFKYKTSFVWDKVKHNMGHYNSVRHEILLVCVRGSCPPDVPQLFDSVQSIERTEHSVKPEEFRTIIDTIYPLGDRIELFARRSVDGWAVFGNEV